MPFSRSRWTLCSRGIALPSSQFWNRCDLGLSTAGCQLLRSLRKFCAEDSPDGRVQRGPFSGRKMVAEKLWREFFSDPSEWWDNRPEKANSRYPDFTHKKTQQSLWLDNSLTPPWVEAELATMPPGTPQADVYSWNVRLRRHVKAGDHRKTLELFQQMQIEGIIPDKFTFVPVVNACSGLQNLEKGRLAHEKIIERGYESNLYVATGLVDMYAKCGSIGDAWSVFSKMQERSVVSWNAMIGGYVKAGQGLKAMELFRKMQQEKVEPDPVTFVGALNACASMTALGEGRRIHEEITLSGSESDVYVATCLVDMYAKCGSMEDARTVFNKMPEHDVVSWNALIAGYVTSGGEPKAMVLLRKMRQEGVEPDAGTFVGLLNICANTAALEEGRHLHQEISLGDYGSDVYVANCLIDMYAKCGSVEDSWTVFNNMHEHNVVSWTAIIAGYVKSGQGMKAMELYLKMQQAGVDPDGVTFAGALNACASIEALEEGRRVHGDISRRGLESDVYVATCLVDMYAKCGSLEDAWSVFNRMQERNVVSWTTMIGGYAMHGHANKAIGLFKTMVREGLDINGVTATCLLSACSHGGLVKEGLRYFKSMASCHNLLPTTEHYVSVVDILGRAGWLQEAEELAKRMPVERDPSVWRSLLGSCRIHGNINMAERSAKLCWELDPNGASGHVLLSNTYAAARGCEKSAAIGEL